jgi:hypothetical protein
MVVIVDFAEIDTISDILSIDVFPLVQYLLMIYIFLVTSVDTEMCCPKGKCGCQYFILLTLKKKIMDTGVLDFFKFIDY